MSHLYILIGWRCFERSHWIEPLSSNLKRFHNFLISLSPNNSLFSTKLWTKMKVWSSNHLLQPIRDPLTEWDKLNTNVVFELINLDSLSWHYFYFMNILIIVILLIVSIRKKSDSLINAAKTGNKYNQKMKEILQMLKCWERKDCSRSCETDPICTLQIKVVCEK